MADLAVHARGLARALAGVKSGGGDCGLVHLVPMDFDISNLEDTILIALGILSAAVPLARHIATLTANKTDDETVEKVAKAIHDFAGWLPTLQLNKALTLEQKRTLKENGQ